MIKIKYKNLHAKSQGIKKRKAQVWRPRVHKKTTPKQSSQNYNLVGKTGHINIKMGKKNPLF